MCLTGAAFAAFLNILSPESVSSIPGLFTVHSRTGNVYWVLKGSHWCARKVAAPRLRALRMAEA